MSQNKIQIRVSKNADGYVFRLDPRTKNFLSRNSTHKPTTAEKLFLAYETDHDSQDMFDHFYQQVATLLTGLTIDLLLPLGTIQFIDSVDETILFEKEPVHV